MKLGHLVFPVLGLLVAFAFAACGDGEPAPDSNVDSVPEQSTENYYTRQSEGGQTAWELWGLYAQSFPSDPRMHLTTVRMVFHSDGEPEAELTSDTAVVDQKTQQTVAKGNVVVINNSGRRLESEVLYWDPEKQLIHTDVFFRHTEGDQVLTGYGMDTDPDLANVRVHSQLQGEWHGSEEGVDEERR